MPLPADDAEIAAWVRSNLAALDTTERDRRWRQRARGMTVGQAMAGASRIARCTLDVPVGDHRVVRVLATARDESIAGYLRRAAATAMCAVEGIEAATIPWFSADGLLGPK